MASTMYPSSAVKGRYRDAYSVSDSIVEWGKIVKVLGVAAGIVIALLGFAAAANLGGGAVIMSLIFAVVVAVQYYMFGIMIAAQGQMLLAVLDTAVNTSPLLSLEEKVEVIVALRASASSTHPVIASAADPGGVNPPTTRCPSCGTTVYTTAKMCSSCWKPLS